jgi:hypothetical protein
VRYASVRDRFSFLILVFGFAIGDRLFFFLVPCNIDP